MSRERCAVCGELASRSIREFDRTSATGRVIGVQMLCPRHFSGVCDRLFAYVRGEAGPETLAYIVSREKALCDVAEAVAMLRPTLRGMRAALPSEYTLLTEALDRLDAIQKERP